MTFSPNITVMFIAQFLAGLGTAMISPTFVVQIAHNYSGVAPQAPPNKPKFYKHPVNILIQNTIQKHTHR